jgi:hypothetical protein
MKADEIHNELTHPGAHELLASTSSAHLSYIAADGNPRVVPVGYYWNETVFVVSTATTAPKVSALQARPTVALAIEGGSTPDQACALSVRGQAEVTIVDGVVEEYLLAARKSMGEQAAAEFEANVKQMYPQMARIAIAPTWVRYYDFGGGRLPQFLQDLAAAGS